MPQHRDTGRSFVAYCHRHSEYGVGKMRALGGAPMVIVLIVAALLVASLVGAALGIFTRENPPQ